MSSKNYSFKATIKTMWEAKCGGAWVILDLPMMNEWAVLVRREAGGYNRRLFDTTGKRIDSFDYLAVNGMIQLDAFMSGGAFIATRFSVPFVELFTFVDGEHVRVPVFERSIQKNQKYRGVKTGYNVKRKGSMFIQYSPDHAGENLY